MIPINNKQNHRVGLVERRFFRVRELTLIGAVLVILLFLLVARPMPAEGGAAAVITLDGEEIMRVLLGDDRRQRIDLLESYGVPVSFQVEDGGIRFVGVTCPDHICEKTGFIRGEGQTAVCMPNLVAVVIIDS